MATIKLLPRKEFEIHLDEVSTNPVAVPQVIKGQFGTWALKRMCDKLKCKLYELQDRFSPKDASGKEVAADVEVYTEFLLCAVEQKARQDKQPFSYTDVDAGMWIDEMGGRNSAMMLKIVGHSADETTDINSQKKTTETVDA